jgi:hypothetical protein
MDLERKLAQFKSLQSNLCASIITGSHTRIKSRWCDNSTDGTLDVREGKLTDIVSSSCQSQLECATHQGQTAEAKAGGGEVAAQIGGAESFRESVRLFAGALCMFSLEQPTVTAFKSTIAAMELTHSAFADQ